eukprot:4909735-Pyramimonas_sp.AAC.1
MQLQSELQSESPILAEACEVHRRPTLTGLLAGSRCIARVFLGGADPVLGGFQGGRQAARPRHVDGPCSSHRYIMGCSAGKAPRPGRGTRS